MCRCKGGGIQVLTDAEAVVYVNSQANAGLRKHEKNTRRMFTAIDPNQLDEHGRRQLESNQKFATLSDGCTQGSPHGIPTHATEGSPPAEIPRNP